MCSKDEVFTRRDCRRIRGSEGAPFGRSSEVVVVKGSEWEEENARHLQSHYYVPARQLTATPVLATPKSISMLDEPAPFNEKGTPRIVLTDVVDVFSYGAQGRDGC